MHDQMELYEKTLENTTGVFRNDPDGKGNLQFYPRKARMGDLQVMGHAIAAKSACIDRENGFLSSLCTA
ncbi:MAG: hypothetical protein RJA19_167 [Bacteroidota bacterium]|jgi:hypothetical protein